MDRLTYLKGQRSAARKKLKSYLIIFRDQIEEECEISFPTSEEIKKFTSEEFDNWFTTIETALKEKSCYDLVLTELIENYICAINNVAIAEFNAHDMYF